ncbi:hypothetical protein J23TS9_54790 [Paenibacillus sp. J23TS9]|uniref:S-layer homology domain-containing protein n=1 Tax=Paenibacillus sp. J23TS9 TaxID=2807193 RepID=UPI001AFEE465|nr:S-layer homology domain-containing protein [Paenibacillus sp. J23TS9]GIP30349.1 hypothetical protein J23TS9_54790 [Paenibacillus sp. J23TS9]
MSLKGKSISILSAAALLGALVPHASADASLSDISNSYAKDAINELVSRGIIHGNGDGKFNPASGIQRQDFAVILANALQLDLSHPPGTPTFKDVPKENYAYAAVEAAVKAGLFKGMGNGIFGAGQNLTREQMAVIFVNALGVNPAGKGRNLTFSDTAFISTWAKDAVAAAVELGLIHGYPDGNFNPGNKASRQDAALVTVQFLNNKAKADEGSTRQPPIVPPTTPTTPITPTPTPIPTPIPTPSTPPTGGGEGTPHQNPDQAIAELVKAEIAALPAKANIKLSDKPAVVQARAHYHALTDTQKTLVGDITKLTEAEQAIAELEAQAVADEAAASPVRGEIQALPTKADVKLTDKPAVTQARAHYDALTDAQKALVGDIAKLTEAEQAIAELEAQAAADEAAASLMKSEIASLPSKVDVALTDKPAVVQARTHYDALTDAQKALVGGIAKLTEAEQAIAELEAQAAADEAAASLVKSEIASLPSKVDVALTDKPAVVQARAHYHALTDTQKTLVGDIAKLTEAEQAIAELEAQAALDEAAAVPVRQEIAALPAKAAAKLTDKPAVTQARAHYDALTDAQKILVGNIAILTEAEQAIAELEAQAALDEQAAALVRAEIASLPSKSEVTLSDKTAVSQARAHYDALTGAQKTLVGGIAKLTEAEQAIAELEAQAALDEAAAAPVREEIQALPAKADIKLTDEPAVTQARAHYAALTDSQKTRVGGIARLTDAEDMIMDLRIVVAAKGNLQVVYNGVAEKIALTSAQDGATVAWSLKDPEQSSIVDISTGSVEREGLNENTDVVLIANITAGAASDTKEITVHVKAVMSEPETITSKAVSDFDFSTIDATQARGESFQVQTTDFQSATKHFTISDGKITIPIDLTWNVPQNEFTKGQIMGSVVDSFIQDYCNAHGINLGNRTLGAVGFGNTFSIFAFSTGSASSVTLGGPDWQYFFSQRQYNGNDIDHSRNRTFNVSDGEHTAIVTLDRQYAGMEALVEAINSQLQGASVAAAAETVNANQFRLVAKSADIALSVSGADQEQFFGSE